MPQLSNPCGWLVSVVLFFFFTVLPKQIKPML